MLDHNFKNDFISIGLIKEAAHGRTLDILENVAGIPADHLDGKHHPCPACGGKDRFRLLDADAGAAFCNQCFNEKNGDFIAAVRQYRNVSLPEALRLIADYLGIAPEPTPAKETTDWQTVKTWTYTDETGTPIYYVDRKERLVDGKREKKFVQYRKEDGQTVYNIKGVTPVPLHLSELSRRINEPIFIVEGEKCCDVVSAFGLLATTASGGSNSKLDWSKHIPNRQVVIFPDEDKKGCEYALRVADQLHEADCTIKIVSLPGLGEGEDVADWIEHGGTRDELLRIVEETPVWDGSPFSYMALDESGEPASALQPEFTPCGIASLDAILTAMEPVDWKAHSEKVYILRTIDQILKTAKTIGFPIVNHNGIIYYWTGTHYVPISGNALQNFLLEAAIQCGVPNDTAEFLNFVEKMGKQFLISAARKTRIQEPNGACINLKNGTFFFDKKGRRFEKHSPKLFIRYVLHFDYDPAAVALLWQLHLDRSLPIPEKQWYLAACLALPFYPGKIEKAPIIFGQQDTGKSTTLDVYENMIGVENISAELLVNLTKSDTQGDYARASLDGKLVNIGKDISSKINDEGITKTLISREAVSARHPYQKPFTMRNYARLVFAMNEVPPQFFSDTALTKRMALIGFNHQIASDEKDIGFTEKIIADELSGVLNWIVSGLDRLIATGRLDPPQCCVDEMESLRKELDPLSNWLEHVGYYPGSSEKELLESVYGGDFIDSSDGFRGYCKRNGHQPLSLKTFAKRLKGLGFTIYRPNNHTGRYLYYQTFDPKNPAPSSLLALSSEYEDEIRAATGAGLKPIESDDF